MSGRKFNIPANIQGRITKVFVTNLPEKCSGNDLSYFVRSYGDIYDLYIARKRDKAGNRFVFVSFLDVKDSRDLVRQVCNTRIGDCWLKANIARFTLEEGEIGLEPDNSKRKPDSRENTARKEQRPPARAASSFFNGTRSYSDTLTGRQGSLKDVKMVIVDNQVNAFRGLHGKALVARMIDLEALKSIYLILNDICPGLGRVQYLGGLSVLISFEDIIVTSLVLEAARGVIGRFSSVDYWEGQTFGYDRLAWLKVMGIPLHLITDEVIDAVGSIFGKIAHRAKRSDSNGDLSYDYIGVLVGDGKRIGEEVTLLWRDRKFNIWISEESGEWVSEFYQVTTSVPESVPPEGPTNSGNESLVADVGKLWKIVKSMGSLFLGIFLILKRF
ncbi:putative RNA recognition motif domain, nucleotide-binding alpha-beta plait domain superfamily [Helianthus annuus]|nr:putative RNA recognition motif domain, nucleotide-binding alpha-beta plait domain superfamily [Helianthus annuus]